jgi:hypothetical protein
MPAIMTLEHSLATWLPAQRWFPGGDAAVELAIIADTPLASGDPGLRHLVVGVSSGGDAVRYQVLAGVRAEVPKALKHAVIGPDGRGGTAYDALHDPELTHVLLIGIASGRAAGPLRFVAEPGAPIDTTAGSLVLSAEQSNTSLIFGESAILKVFRRVFAGQNPDLEVTRALARLGSQHVAAPFGWIEARLDGDGDGDGDDGGSSSSNGGSSSSSSRAQRSAAAAATTTTTTTAAAAATVMITESLPCSPCCRNTCAAPAMAGRSPRPACATCTPPGPAARPRPAATSAARRTGSAPPPPACTPTWPPPSAPACWSPTPWPGSPRR